MLLEAAAAEHPMVLGVVASTLSSLVLEKHRSCQAMHSAKETADLLEQDTSLDR